MEFIFITLFPEMIEQASRVSIIGRAVEQGLVSVTCINPRDYATDRHRSVDASPCGGGAGMVLQAGTYCKALLTHINDSAAAFLFNHLQCSCQLIATVAAQAAESITGQTLAVYKIGRAHV